MKITKVDNSAKFLQVEAVEMEKPTVEALINAERISGKSQGYEFLAAVVSQVAKFDGNSLPMEEVKRLSSKDFLSIVGELDLADIEVLPIE